MFPPLPSFDGLHPLVVHFPIALLLVAPLFMVAALALPRRGLPFAISALALMVLGTTAAFVAVGSGQAAAELAMRTPEMAPVLERHEELAELTRNLFAVLALVYAAVIFVPRWLPRLKTPARVAAQVVFVLVYSGGALLLANTAHQGGRLVHQFGVQAMLAAEAPSPSSPTPTDASARASATTNQPQIHD